MAGRAPPSNHRGVAPARVWLARGMSRPLSVQVWSDVACPWCYIGKRRLEKAVRAFDGEVTVEYRSFELAPDTPVDFQGSAVDFLCQFKGLPREQVQRMIDHVTVVAAGEGLRYDFAALRQTRTLLAHQAIHHAKAHGRQAEMVERLFQAHFEQGRHLGRVSELVALAAEVGLDPDGTRRVLTEGTYSRAVAEDVDAARRLGIRGVPCFVIDERYAVSGAQEPAVLVEALRRAAKERVATGG